MIRHGMHERDLQHPGEDVSRAGTSDRSKVVGISVSGLLCEVHEYEEAGDIYQQRPTPYDEIENNDHAMLP